MSNDSENVLLIGVGIICYGGMAWLCIYILISMISWHPLFLGIWVIMAWSLFCVAYSAIRVYKNLKSTKDKEKDI